MYRFAVFFVAINIVFLPESLETPEQQGEPRIINGFDCDPKEFPFFLTITSRTLCGGSLITWSWVLTAAHCLHTEDIENVTVKVHTVYSAPANFTQERVMQRVVVHPKYTKKLMLAVLDIRYDLGLIMVNEPFQASPYTQIAALPKPGFTKKCTNGLAAGIGKTHHKEDIPGLRGRSLKCVNLKIVDVYTFCKETFPEAVMDDSMICTKEPTKDTCVGDSGGPFICDFVLIGIVSYGPIECGISPGSATFTKVENYLDFIDATVHPKSHETPRKIPRKTPRKTQNGRRSRPIASLASRINLSVSKLKLLFLSVFYCFTLIR